LFTTVFVLKIQIQSPALQKMPEFVLEAPELSFAVSPLKQIKGGEHITQKERSLGSFVLLENTGFQQFVDELLHGVVSAQETLGRHDDTDVALGNGSGTVFTGLESNEIETNHSTGEMDLTDTISKNFFLTHNSFFLNC
jgi:hypothetical protein